MSKQNVILAPSILSADFFKLGDDVNAALDAGADWIHVDVMDNHYVPNLTFGPVVCKALRNGGINAFMDVHLMVKPVDNLIETFADVGANMITVHPESTEHLDRTLNLIKSKGCKAGLAFNPSTSPHLADHVLHLLDMILVMSVNPGFSGQSFIPQALIKLKHFRTMIDDSRRDIRLQVDGGINSSTLTSAFEAGADTFVMGAGFFGNENYRQVVREFRSATAS